MGTITADVGERVRLFRLQRGLTQEQLAELADLHNTYIGQIERGEKNLSIVSLDKILGALNVSYAAFFEPIDLPREHESIAVQCYQIVDGKSPAQQAVFLHILKELDHLTK